MSRHFFLRLSLVYESMPMECSLESGMLIVTYKSEQGTAHEKRQIVLLRFECTSSAMFVRCVLNKWKKLPPNQKEEGKFCVRLTTQLTQCEAKWDGTGHLGSILLNLYQEFLSTK